MTIDAEDLFLRHYLGLLDERVAAPTATWIRSRQRPDGSWATYHGGPGDLSTSVEAYVALRLAGDPADAAHMARAAAFIRDAGGVGQSRVFTRMWLSLLDLWSWGEVPTLPPEQILLPPRAPLSVYSFGCWARQTIVALSVVTALRPAVAVAFGIDELRAGGQAASPRPTTSGGGRSSSSTGPPTSTGAIPFGRLRRRALRTAERWIVERQERDGSWGGIQPPWVWSIVALHALGYPLDHPVLKRAPRRPRHLHDRATTRAAGSRPASHRSGTRRSRCSPSSTRASSPAATTIARACAWLVGPGGRDARGLGGAPAGARARRLPVRVRERATTPTSTTRR